MVTLRDAAIGDLSLLLQWRNDPLTRAASRNTAEVSPEIHEAWFKEVLGNPLRKVLIAEERGHPVGTVRLDWNGDNSLELSWTVAPTERGRGVAKRMVKLAVDRVGDRWSVTAEVKEGNDASASVAEAAGFTLARREGGWLVYERSALPRQGQPAARPD